MFSFSMHVSENTSQQSVDGLDFKKKRAEYHKNIYWPALQKLVQKPRMEQNVEEEIVVHLGKGDRRDGAARDSEQFTDDEERVEESSGSSSGSGTSSEDESGELSVKSASGSSSSSSRGAEDYTKPVPQPPNAGKKLLPKSAAVAPMRLPLKQAKKPPAQPMAEVKPSEEQKKTYAVALRPKKAPSPPPPSSTGGN